MRMSVPWAARSSRRRCAQRRRRVVLYDAVVLHCLVDRRFDRVLSDERVEQRRQHRADYGGAPCVAQLRLREARRAEEDGAGDEIGAAPCRSLDSQPRERCGEIGYGVWSPGIVAPGGGAHRGDSRVLAVQTRRVLRRRERAHVLGPKVRRRESGDDVEGPRELENVQRVRVHGRCFLADPRTRAVGVCLSSSGTLVLPALRGRWS